MVLITPAQSLWQRGCAIYDAIDPLLSFDLFSGMITFPIALAWGGVSQLRCLNDCS